MSIIVQQPIDSQTTPMIRLAWKMGMRRAAYGLINAKLTGQEHRYHRIAQSADPNVIDITATEEVRTSRPRSPRQTS
jgi:hypothetical protein